MGLVSGAEVAFRMVGDNAEGFAFGVETVLRVSWDDKDLAGRESDFFCWRDAVAVTTDNDSDAMGGVGVL